jgi:hypothetical protein
MPHVLDAGQQSWVLEPHGLTDRSGDEQEWCFVLKSPFQRSLKRLVSFTTVAGSHHTRIVLFRCERFGASATRWLVMHG